MAALFQNPVWVCHPYIGRTNYYPHLFVWQHNKQVNPEEIYLLIPTPSRKQRHRASRIQRLMPAVTLIGE